MPHIAMPLQYVIDMHCYQSISLVQNMVLVLVTTTSRCNETTK